MLHYEVDPAALQLQVPFELDTFNGRAYVSLVAFELQRMAIDGAPRLINQAVGAVASNRFLNVRTYVRGGGIFFLAEWLDNAPAVLLGPIFYGLPYRLGQLDYDHQGDLRGSIEAGASLAYHGRAAGPFARAERGSRTEFLMERYTALTARLRRRSFRVEHEPWPQAAADVVVEDDSLIHATGPWFRAARFCGATFSPGVDVVMHMPRTLRNIQPRMLYSRA